MPDWAFWLLVWWAGWFAALLVWYDRNKAESLHPGTCFFMFLLAGFAPFVAVIFVISKAFGKDN